MIVIQNIFIYKKKKMKNLFKGQTISLVACGLLLSSSMAFGADTIDSAFKEGKVSGSLALYGAKYDLKDGGTDSGYGNGNATVAFETGSFYGLSAKAEFKRNLKLGELEHNDYNDGDIKKYPNAVRDKLNLVSPAKYKTDLFEWL